MYNHVVVATYVYTHLNLESDVMNQILDLADHVGKETKSETNKTRSTIVELATKKVASCIRNER